jgi:TPR repeat protein
MKKSYLILIVLVIIITVCLIMAYWWGPFNFIEVKKLKKLAESGDGEACWCLSGYYEGIADNDASEYYLKKGALLGEPRSQYLFADYLMHKRDIKDINDGLEYIEKSARQEYADAQITLGKLYSDGKRVSPNLALSEYWYRKAAYNGHAFAMYELSKILADKHNDKKNLIEAYKWLELAVLRSNPKSAFYQDIIKQKNSLINKVTMSGFDCLSLQQSAELIAKEEQQTIPKSPLISGGYSGDFKIRCKDKIRIENN